MNAAHQSRSYKVLQGLWSRNVQKQVAGLDPVGPGFNFAVRLNMSQVMPRGQCGSISCIIVVSNENDFGLRVGEPPGGLALLSFVHRAECQMFGIDLPSGLQMEMEASKSQTHKTHIQVPKHHTCSYMIIYEHT